MRTRRLKRSSDLADAYYHCTSRVVNREHVFKEREKKRFIQLMRIYERFCHLRILSYCVMSNHFHILVEVPKRPLAMDLPDDEGLIAHVNATLDGSQGQALAWQLKLLRDQGAHQEAEALRAKWFARMWDVSAFMKVFKQRFTQWFNGTREKRRCGTLWEDRFHSVLVEGQCNALEAMSAYIDLNPLRAGMVKDPQEYLWCSYAEAVAGGRLASGAVQWLMNLPAHGGARTVQAERTEQESLERYRRVLFGVEGAPQKQLDAEKVAEVLFGVEGAPQKQLDAEKVAEVLRAGGKLPRHAYLRCRVRYFSDGVILGSREFVEEIFHTAQEHFSPKRKSGARPMRGQECEKAEPAEGGTAASAEGGGANWPGQLCTCRDFKVRLFGSPE